MIISVLMMCAGSLMIAVHADLRDHRRAGAGAAAGRAPDAGPLGRRRVRHGRHLHERGGVEGHRGFYSSFQYVTLIGGQLLALLVLAVLQALLTDRRAQGVGLAHPVRDRRAGGGRCDVSAPLARRDGVRGGDAQQGGRLADRACATSSARRAASCSPSRWAARSTSTRSRPTCRNIWSTPRTWTPRSSRFVMTVVLIVFMLLQPVFGALSDRIGRKNNMILFTALGRSPPRRCCSRSASVSSPYAAFVLVLLALAIASFYTSISGVVKAELFPTEVRALGVGFTYAVANALFGGTAEYVALWLKSVGAGAMVRLVCRRHGGDRAGRLADHARHAQIWISRRAPDRSNAECSSSLPLLRAILEDAEHAQRFRSPGRGAGERRRRAHFRRSRRGKPRRGGVAAQFKDQARSSPVTSRPPPSWPQRTAGSPAPRAFACQRLDRARSTSRPAPPMPSSAPCR